MSVWFFCGQCPFWSAVTWLPPAACAVPSLIWPARSVAYSWRDLDSMSKHEVAADIIVCMFTNLPSDFLVALSKYPLSVNSLLRVGGDTSGQFSGTGYLSNLLFSWDSGIFWRNLLFLISASFSFTVGATGHSCSRSAASSVSISTFKPLSGLGNSHTEFTVSVSVHFPTVQFLTPGRAHSRF